MVFTCFICKKRSDKLQDLSFHRFPSNSIARQQWLDIIGKSEEVIGKATTICSRHFDTECFRYGLVNGKRFLKPGTKPTINFGISAPINIPNMTEFSSIQTSNIPTNEPALRSSIEELATSNKRKQEPPLTEVIAAKKIRLTDLTWEELSESSMRGKALWNAAKQELLNKEKKIECLQRKVRRLKQKVSSLKNC
ncbi:uncharacterized protein LOC143897950 isoform X1 [Temnothorax americanus]|uniref:uncharacterized protein LOC143897950 isoform X1 n=1 Tax=Temnothorax americanus TaxID=1964332 RepID=UPI0040693306